jgi:RNA polymerase sigma-70 factor (ECF subfamily)
VTTDSDPPDADLVGRTLSGDRDAFARLYDRYARLVRAVAADAGRGRIDDVTQEAFLRAYRNLGSLRAADRFSSWLVGIARKVVLEDRRRPGVEPLPDLVVDPGLRPGAAVEDADEVEHLLALVARLPQEQRQAVRFFFLAGRDAEQVARLLGRSRSGAYLLIRQAIGALARWMGADRSRGEVKR